MDKLEIKPAQVIAGALGAVTAAVLGTRLNLAGTVVGAALASVVSSVGAVVYQHSIERTKVRWAAAALSAALVFLVGLITFGGVDRVVGTAVPSPPIGRSDQPPAAPPAPERRTEENTTSPTTTTTPTGGSSVASTTTPPSSTTTPTTTGTPPVSPSRPSTVHTSGS